MVFLGVCVAARGCVRVRWARLGRACLRAPLRSRERAWACGEEGEVEVRFGLCRSCVHVRGGLACFAEWWVFRVCFFLRSACCVLFDRGVVCGVALRVE